MNTNEPTTGEIVRALREDCNVLDYNVDKFAAADRLEIQEREIEELKSEAIVNALDNAERIANLTDRAESAERERDAAIKALTTYEDALFDERDIAYNRGYSDGHRDGNSEQ